MNLWFRLIWLLISQRFRDRLVPPFDISRLNFRAWPLDLDPNLHMNNGRYLVIADLGRMDLMLRGNLWSAAVKKGWTPILSGSLIRYRREIKPFQPFELLTRIIYWNDRNFVMEHRFIVQHHGQDDLAAIALVRGGLYDRKARRFVAPAEIFRLLGYEGPSPDAAADVAAFMAAEDEMKRQQGSVQPEV